MPRCSLVLLVLITFAGLWTPPQTTQAQTGCPEGGCKVFLPLVRTNVVATATVVNLSSVRYCFGVYVSVAVTNVSTEPITKVQLSGNVSSSSDNRQYAFVQTTQDVLFPGETNQYTYRITTYPDQFCATEETTARILVTGASTVPQFQPIEIVSRSLVLESFCEGVYTYRVSGVIRNASAEALTNIRTFLPWRETQLFIEADMTTLAPNESTAFTAKYATFSDLPDGSCYRTPQTLPQDSFIIRSWGEPAP